MRSNTVDDLINLIDERKTDAALKVLHQHPEPAEVVITPGSGDMDGAKVRAQEIKPLMLGLLSGVALALLGLGVAYL